MGKEREGDLLFEEKSGARILVGSEAMVGQIRVLKSMCKCSSIKRIALVKEEGI